MIQHGVPISVKEHVGFKNKTCHTGYVAWLVLTAYSKETKH